MVFFVELLDDLTELFFVWLVLRDFTYVALLLDSTFFIILGLFSSLCDAIFELDRFDLIFYAGYS